MGPFKRCGKRSGRRQNGITCVALPFRHHHRSENAIKSQKLHRKRLIDPDGNNIEGVNHGPNARMAESVVVVFEGLEVGTRD